MTPLQFALASFSTFTGIMKLLCDEPLSLLGHTTLNSKNTFSILIITLGFEEKEWMLNFNENRTSSINR